MNHAPEDPRVSELLRRRVTKTPPSGVPDGQARRLEDGDKEAIRKLAAANPSWSASDLADNFEAEHGWRPSYQGIGRSLSAPAPRAKGTRKAASREPAARDPAAEVEAIASVSRALAPLSLEEVRRVLDWARARFQADGEEGGRS